MEEYDLLFETVSKLELSDEQKQAILAPAKKLNEEAGKRGSDLMSLKKEKEAVEKDALSYKAFTKALADNNIKIENAHKLAKELGIKKTQDDNIEELKKILSDKDNALKEVSSKLKMFEVEKTLKPKFEEAVKNYRDGEGKPFKFMPDLVEQTAKELFNNINENDDEVIVNDRINKALEKTRVDQENFIKRNNIALLQGNTHQVDERVSTGNSSGRGINGEEIRKIIVEGNRDVNAAAAALAAMRNSQ